MLPSMETATPFRDFVEGWQTGYQIKREKRQKPFAIAADFPCSLCAGEGYLLQTITISKMDSPLEPFARKSGEPIKINDFVLCPACAGSGVDFESAGASL